MKQLAKIQAVLFVLAAGVAHVVVAGGESEAAGGAGQRSQYLAERGIIVPPDEVHTNSYIAGIDYRYPYPERDFGVYLFNGNRQLSIQGQEDILHIGIQAAKTSFEELPPLNLAFVIDHSGSMGSADKLNWVKDAFDIFITQVRDSDYVSLVVFDDTADVVFPATKMDTTDRRAQFRRAVQSVMPDGSTNIRAGLELGSIEVLKNFNSEYTNRVMFLSDGCDTVGNSSDSILDVAHRFARQGVTISTIGVGESFDLELMVEMAKVGQGSSRFIANREQMEKIFGSELDRMVVAQAKNLEITLEFLVDVTVIDTWGYRNQRNGGTVRYFLPTLHHGDYETILVHYGIKPQRFTGTMDLARFSVKYEDLYGNYHESGPHVIQATFVESAQPVAGISNGMVLRSGTMLHLAENLKKVGELYYGDKSSEGLERALNITVDAKKELVNAKTRLDNDGFDDEIDILNRYIGILSGELNIEETRIQSITASLELAPPTPERSLLEHAENLCGEIALDLRTRGPGRVAVCDFSAQGGDASDLIERLSDLAYASVVNVPSIQIVERTTLLLAMQRRGFELADLTDKIKAVEMGVITQADYILTGTIMEMSDSIIVFSRLLNVRSGEVEAAAQIIVPWS